MASGTATKVRSPKESEWEDVWEDIPSTPNTPTPNVNTPEETGPVGKFFNAAGESIAGAGKGLYNAVVHPQQFGEDIVRGGQDQFKQAGKDFQAGDYSQAFGHGLAGIIPGVGPAAAQVGEDIQHGGYAEALGHGSVLAASLFGPRAAPKVAEVASDIAPRTGRAIAGGLKGGVKAIGDHPYKTLGPAAVAMEAGRFMNHPALGAAVGAIPVIGGMFKGAREGWGSIPSPKYAGPSLEDTTSLPPVIPQGRPNLFPTQEESAQLPPVSRAPFQGPPVNAELPSVSRPVRGPSEMETDELPPVTRPVSSPSVKETNQLPLVSKSPVKGSPETKRPLSGYIKEEKAPTPLKRPEPTKPVSAPTKPKEEPVINNAEPPSAYLNQETTGLQIPQVIKSRAQVAQNTANHLRSMGITSEDIDAMDPAKSADFWNTTGKLPGVSKQKNYSPSPETIDAIKDELSKEVNREPQGEMSVASPKRATHKSSHTVNKPTTSYIDKLKKTNPSLADKVNESFDGMVKEVEKHISGAKVESQEMQRDGVLFMEKLKKAMNLGKLEV